ncbi:unnamed protein product [Adineta ricciae]|uniref:F-box domain-containing protein n=1 Tax=Adineta ricciae TaxID=249248 RepID=A0A814ASI3_ADIRI|nr:unnamed protein product [Adineta ricciae]
MTNLEHLPNEVFHELFEYFNVIELIHAFRNLNSRFNKLLFTSFHSYRLDFRSISKSNFNLVCTRYLPGIIDQVHLLCLSNECETPQLYRHLLNFNLTVDEFTHLHVLLLHRIDSANVLLEITSDCFYLPYLTHLKITKCKFTSECAPKELLNNIWHLNSLTNCTLDMTFEHSPRFSGLSMISKTMKYLSIKCHTFSSMELSHLFSLTPYLQHLSINIGETVDIKSQHIIPALFLTRLNLHFGGTLFTLTKLLQSAPNLRHLKLETESINLNGNQWQQLLTKYVSKIETFRFLIRVLSLKSDHVEEHLEEFFQTFQTSFWLDEHHWYVRCDLPQQSGKLFIFYTLPYCSDSTHVVYQNRWSKTTLPQLGNSNCFDQISDVFYKRCKPNLSLPTICYPNIHRLTLILPHDRNFWTIIPQLDSLTSLKVIEKKEDSRSQYQLKTLLGRARRLNMLNIDALLFLRLLRMNFHHASVRQLELLPYHSKTNRYLNATQCSFLADSSFGQQCEVLLIYIETRTIILDLIPKMCNLRALHIYCQDDRANDDLVEWLKNSLPDTCSIARRRSGPIQIWIQ